MGGVKEILGLNKFPYKCDENGVCEKLENNICMVYDNRPLICNIELWCESMGIDKKLFYRQNMKACKELKNEKICHFQ